MAKCARVAGWAWDRTQPDTPIGVDLYDGSTRLATLSADLARSDLAKAGKGNGKHGFVYVPTATVLGGQVHTIAARVAGTDIALNKSPQTLTCPAP